MVKIKTGRNLWDDLIWTWYLVGVIIDSHDSSKSCSKRDISRWNIDDEIRGVEPVLRPHLRERGSRNRKSSRRMQSIMLIICYNQWVMHEFSGNTCLSTIRHPTSADVSSWYAKLVIINLLQERETKRERVSNHSYKSQLESLNSTTDHRHKRRHST